MRKLRIILGIILTFILWLNILTLVAGVYALTLVLGNKILIPILIVFFLDFMILNYYRFVKKVDLVGLYAEIIGLILGRK